MTRFLFIALALLLSLQAEAAPASPASIEKTLDLMNAQQTMASVWPAVEANMRQSMARAHGGNPPTPEQQAKEERAIQRAMAAMHEQLNWDKMKPQYVKLYGDTFSQEEINGLIAFYQSPAGKAYVAKMPQLTQHTMQLIQGQMTELMPKLMQIMQDAMAQPAGATK